MMSETLTSEGIQLNEDGGGIDGAAQQIMCLLKRYVLVPVLDDYVSVM